MNQNNAKHFANLVLLCAPWNNKKTPFFNSHPTLHSVKGFKMAILSMTSTYDSFVNLLAKSGLLGDPSDNSAPNFIWELFPLFHVPGALQATATNITGWTEIGPANEETLVRYPQLALSFDIEGAFSFGNLGTVQGVVSGYSVSFMGAEVMSVTGMTADAGEFWSSLVSNITVDHVATAFSGHDRLLGSDFADRLLSGLGNDRIFAGDGDDVVYAGSGHDFIRSSGGNNRIYGGSGNDHIILRGQAGDDFVIGGRGNDIISSGGGSDRILGSAGDDAISGQQGNDFLVGGSGNDSMDGGTGNDFIFGNTGADNLSGGNGSDRIRGGAGGDTIFGNLGRDFLQGNDGDDYLHGGQGHDKLSGGSGDDILTGGLGVDSFRFAYATDGTENDQILDWGYSGENGQPLTGEEINIRGTLKPWQVAVTQLGDDTLIAYNDNTITVENALMADVETFLTITFIS